MAQKQAKKKPHKPLQVSVPDDPHRPRWMRVGVLSAVGLALGIAWPSLAGIRIGPQVPGAKKTQEAVSAPAPASGAPALAKAVGTSTVIEGDEPSRNNEQTVVVGGGKITKCFKGKKALKPEQCGKLPTDRLLVPRLKELKRCPSAVGLSGELILGFDIHFTKKTIHVVKGKKSELPSSTVQGIFTCTADYIRDVSADKIPHKYSRYRIFYTLQFYPPGEAPPGEGKKQSGENEEDTRGMAAVTWDTALIRQEPKTGKVIARLVRGTRVKILSRRKDWYRVKLRSKEGWIYRGALGR